MTLKDIAGNPKPQVRGAKPKPDPDLSQFFGKQTFTTRVASVVMGFLISLLTGAVHYFMHYDGWSNLLIVSFTAGLASMVFFIFAFEILVVREVNQIFGLFENIKKKDLKSVKKNLKDYRLTPFSELNTQLSKFIKTKEDEIEELKEVENYRREFIADISHELKTPVFAAQSFIYTLMDGAIDDPEVRDKFLKKAAKSLDGLHGLVEDLDTLSQLESRTLQMNFEKVSLDELISVVLDNLDHKAGKKKIRLQFEKKSDTGIYVWADAKRLIRVISNLTENAIKYGNEQGNVWVGVEGGKEMAEISIRDDGPGIDANHLKHIFDRFYRVDKSRNKERGGSGLGLSIVKHIVEGHYSKVNVTSKPGKGSTFSFKIRRVSAPVVVQGGV